MDLGSHTCSFESIRDVVSGPTMAAIQSFGFSTMTEIQALALPPLLDGKDLRGTAKTGSGKTLAFLIPAVELLHKLNFQPSYGTGVLVLSPTRELAMQTHDVAQQLLEGHTRNGGGSRLTCGVVTGGVDKAQEARLLRRGASILVATPGRLLDHLHNTDQFCLQRLVGLVLDEADKMLEKHFEEAMMSILNVLPKERQTMLFSATKTPKTNELVAVALKETFVDVDVSARKDAVTVDTLKQAYVICPTEKKFLFLYNILKSFEKRRKVMVFFSSCDAVKFYYELLTYIQVDVLCIHGKQEQALRTKSFKAFTSAPAATLLCTDVAARGWDIPEVDFVLQYDPPHDPSEYIHRVGRTARGDRSGEALLMLREQELPFVRCLEKRRARLTEQVFNVDKLPDEQGKVESIVEGIPFLTWWGKKAWKSCIHAYTLHKRKDIFNIYTLDIKKLGKSFGFSHPPNVDLAIEYKRSGEKKLMKRIREGYYEDAYEKGDKEVALAEDSPMASEEDGRIDEQQLKEDKMVTGGVNCNKEESTGSGSDDNGSKKKKSKKRPADDEDALDETEKHDKKKNKKRKVIGNGEADLGANDEEGSDKLSSDSANDGNKKHNKRQRAIDTNDNLADGEEEHVHPGKDRKRKSKKHQTGDSDSTLDHRETDESIPELALHKEELSKKKKKRKNTGDVDPEQQLSQDDSELALNKTKLESKSKDEHECLHDGHTVDGTLLENPMLSGKKKHKKRNREDEITEASVHQDRSCRELSSTSKKKLKTLREEDHYSIQTGQNGSSVLDDMPTETDPSCKKKKHKKSKKHSKDIVESVVDGGVNCSQGSHKKKHRRKDIHSSYERQ